MLFALGLGDRVVAVTHECDYPPRAASLPHLTRSVIPEGLPAGEIDRAVRERTERGEALYELDGELLAELAPDLVVTQAVCEVCAVAYEEVRAAARRLPSRPAVLSLDPESLDDVLADVGRLAEAAGRAAAGATLVDEARGRLERVRAAVAGAPAPRVLCLEWLDPPFVAGHWVPEMVELAGGENLIGTPGERSRTVSWEELQRSGPDLVISMPCGYGTDRAARETLLQGDRLARTGAGAIHAVDAAAYFSRPGPRLVDGIELLAHLLHPGRVPPPPPGRARALDCAASPG